MARALIRGRNLGKWSKRKYDAIDARLLEAREEKRIVRELTEHVGGKPSITQQLIIQRVARSLIMVSIIERRVLETRDLRDLESRQLVALNNQALRALTALGLKATKQDVDTLKSYIRVA